jgi:carbon-monoxide dehydrogenase large subunit
VDTETGEVRILKNAGCFDGGTPINPKMCEGQIEGGMTMAFGAALYEQQLYGQKGELLNPSFHDYKIPTIEDVPDNASMVALLEPVPQPDGPFGAKGIGEVCSIPAPPAISNAIYNAVGVRIKELPITGEKIVKALNKKGNNSKA